MTAISLLPRQITAALLILPFALSGCVSRPLSGRKPSADERAIPKFEEFLAQTKKFPYHFDPGLALKTELQRRLAASALTIEAYRPDEDALSFVKNVNAKIYNEAYSQGMIFSVGTAAAGGLVLGFGSFLIGSEWAKKKQSTHSSGLFFLAAGAIGTAAGWSHSAAFTDANPRDAADVSHLLKRDELELAAGQTAGFIGGLVSMETDQIQRFKTALIDEVFEVKTTERIKAIDPIEIALRERVIDTKIAKALGHIRVFSENLKKQPLTDQRLAIEHGYLKLAQYTLALDLLSREFGARLNTDERVRVETGIQENLQIMNQISEIAEGRFKDYPERMDP